MSDILLTEIDLDESDDLPFDDTTDETDDLENGEPEDELKGGDPVLFAGLNKPVREYQELVDEGCAARLAGDYSFSKLGSLAIELEIVPGAHTIEAYAKDIGVGRSTLFGYKQFAAFYPAHIQGRYLKSESPITYTHMRSAMAGHTLEEACDLLDTQWANFTTPDEADREAVIGDDTTDDDTPKWSKEIDTVAPFAMAQESFARLLQNLDLPATEQVQIRIYRQR